MATVKCTVIKGFGFKSGDTINIDSSDIEEVRKRSDSGCSIVMKKKEGQDNKAKIRVKESKATVDAMIAGKATVPAVPSIGS